MLLELKKSGAKINGSFSMYLLQLQPAKGREELMYCSKPFNLGAAWMCVVRFTPPPLYLRGKRLPLMH
jgi:hypothetical protein